MFNKLGFELLPTHLLTWCHKISWFFLRASLRCTFEENIPLPSLPYYLQSLFTPIRYKVPIRNIRVVMLENNPTYINNWRDICLLVYFWILGLKPALPLAYTVCFYPKPEPLFLHYLWWINNISFFNGGWAVLETLDKLIN